MAIFSWLEQLWSGVGNDVPTASSPRSSSDLPDVNPATGLPMPSGTCGLDIQGNPFGADLSHQDTFSASIILDDELDACEPVTALCDFGSIDSTTSIFDDSTSACGSSAWDH